MDYSESLAFLYGLGHEVLSAKYGLESIGKLLQALGWPQSSFSSVIVAGTNGKGSTAAMIEAALRAAGHRTALYTSPHLIRIEERIRVAGQQIPQDLFADLATRVRGAAEELISSRELESHPTFFEQVTAIAMLYFQEASAELAILEVGLGGRLDATNIVDPVVAVVTSIDFDHKEILGSEITQIASEKAAVIKSGSTAVVAMQHHRAALDVVAARCEALAVSWTLASEPMNITASLDGRLRFDYESANCSYQGVELGLRGRHQAQNAAAAIEALAALSRSGLAVPKDAVSDGLRCVTWPGRIELIEGEPPLLLDGAHNPGGARRLRQYLDEFCAGPITLVFGVMADKDMIGIAAELFPAASTIVLTRVKDRRAATGAQLGKAALGASCNVIFTETVRQALSWARSITPRHGTICAAGSLYLIGEIEQLIEDEDSQRNFI
jgi:dihydrofolate synthase/folylpolyglutamate synthase